MAFAGEVLGVSSLNTRQLRAALAERFPEHDAAALTFACRNLLALVQLPPRGLWSRGGQVVGTTAEACLTVRSPIPKHRRRSACSRSTTTCCCRTPTAPGSSAGFDYSNI
jgi:hypothetical protein